MQVKEEPACTEAGRNLGLLAQYHCSDEILVWKCSCFVVTKRSPPVVRLNPQSNRFCGEKTHDASIYKVASRAAQKRTSIRSVPYYVLFSVKRRHGEPVRRGKQWAACRQLCGSLRDGAAQCVFKEVARCLACWGTCFSVTAKKRVSCFMARG
ncbi:uncharacterized protein LOC135091114 isoform X4 [Scylla paramamosain]|uniref:uncharacterized protein LOC135091114 isoform X4 n=2 Tax=Scylla paramamosain TaxID=85552 RepID=UPI003082E5AB